MCIWKFNLYFLLLIVSITNKNSFWVSNFVWPASEIEIWRIIFSFSWKRWWINKIIKDINCWCTNCLANKECLNDCWNFIDQRSLDWISVVKNNICVCIKLSNLGTSLLKVFWYFHIFSIKTFYYIPSVISTKTKAT